MGLFTKQSAITTQIEAITNLPAINQWDAVATLCETINAREDGAKEAAKVLRKKLRLGRPQQQMNALSLISAMVDACGSKFKAQLATAKFAEDIEAVVISDATDVNVKIRLMERLAIWAESFGTDPGLAIIPQLYYTLVKNNTPRGTRNGPPSPTRAPLTPEQHMRQMAQDIELARNNAHMLIEAVSFADPELEAIEENDLIKEFHSKCLTLQRGIQQYLSEITESENPDEQWLTSLLACNQELVQAFTAYNQMMERQHLNRATKTSQLATETPVSRPTTTPRPASPDLMQFSNGAGVGNGQGNGNGHVHSNGNGKTSSNGHGKGAAEPAADPFADEPYFVAGPTDSAKAVKSSNAEKIFDASAYFKQQQLEQEQLQALKSQQMQLHLEQENAVGGSGGSSSAASQSVPTSTHP